MLQANYHDLYWAVGDAGPQEDPNDHGQRTDILFGSMVRISVPSDGTGYQVPSNNYPGAGKSSGTVPALYMSFTSREEKRRNNMYVLVGQWLLPKCDK